MAVTGYKLDLSEYLVEAPRGVSTNGKLDSHAPYDVRGSICTVLLSPQQQLGPAELLDRFELVTRIREHQGEAMILDRADFAKIRQAFNLMKGLGENEVELVRRVFKAPEVELTEAAKEAE